MDVAPAPGVGVLLAGVGVGVAGVGVGGFLILTLARAVAGDPAWGEVPVAVRVRRVPAFCWGTVSIAISSVGGLEAAMGHVAVPGHGQTVNAGESLPGLAVTVTMTSPVAEPANQTQMA